MKFSITEVDARADEGRVRVTRNRMRFGAKRAREAGLRIKRAHTAQLRKEVYRLRYRAYRKEDAIEPSAAGTFEDQYDDQPNHVLWALTFEQKLVGSFRTTWFDPSERQPIPEMRGYSDDLAQLVPDGACILSGNRLVTDPDLSSANAQAVLLLLRHLLVTASHKASDWAVAAARTNHLAFYRRVFRVNVASESRVYPGLRCPMHLMACDLKQNRELIMERTPLLKPRGYEQILLDPNCVDLWEIGLPLKG
jgi:hypothetical protein